MTNSKKPNIEPLDPKHDRAAFSCGVAELDDYLRKQAGQDNKSNIARVFVATGDRPEDIIGYYTLSSFGIDLTDIPESERRKLPKYPQIPAAIIGRLAVSKDCQGTGLGRFLLVDALYRILSSGSEIANYAAVVDAKDDSAVAFYEKFGFQRFPSQPKRLFIPMATVKKLFQGA